MRRYLRSILDPFVTVVEAKDGQVALDAAQKAPPDLILTDVRPARIFRAPGSVALTTRARRCRCSP